MPVFQHFIAIPRDDADRTAQDEMRQHKRLTVLQAALRERQSRGRIFHWIIHIHRRPKGDSFTTSQQRGFWAW